MTNKERAALDRTFRRALSNYKPPEPLTVSQWAERYRVLSRESAAEAGPWRNARTPYLVDIMDAFNDPRIREISVVAPSQVGKSEAQLNAIGYIIDQDPASTIYIQPNLDDAKKFSRTRIAPMLRDSPRLRDKVSEVRSRDSGNTVLQKSFPGGMLTIVGSQSPSALASTPARYVIGDEVDRWALSAGTEGDPWGLATARTTTYYNAKMMAVSTPTLKGFSRIEDLFNGGTQEHWCTRCPDCGEWHEIILDDIRFDHEATEHKRAKQYTVSNVAWCCPSCGTLHTEEEMRRQPARWIADAPEAIKRGRRSFWMHLALQLVKFQLSGLGLRLLDAHLCLELFLLLLGGGLLLLSAIGLVRQVFDIPLEGRNEPIARRLALALDNSLSSELLDSPGRYSEEVDELLRPYESVCDRHNDASLPDDACLRRSQRLTVSGECNVALSGDLGVALDDDVREAWVQLYEPSLAASALARHESRAGAAERVEHDPAGTAAVLDELGDQGDGLHGRVLRVAQGLVAVQHRRRLILDRVVDERYQVGQFVEAHFVHVRPAALIDDG